MEEVRVVEIFKDRAAEVMEIEVEAEVVGSVEGSVADHQQGPRILEGAGGMADHPNKARAVNCHFAVPRNLVLHVLREGSTSTMSPQNQCKQC